MILHQTEIRQCKKRASIHGLQRLYGINPSVRHDSRTLFACFIERHSQLFSFYMNDGVAKNKIALPFEVG